METVTISQNKLIPSNWDNTRHKNPLYLLFLSNFDGNPLLHNIYRVRNVSTKMQKPLPHKLEPTPMAQLSSLSAETETLRQVLSLVEAFRAFDADNDGKITAAELGGILGSLGYNPSEQDVRAMMQEGDTNKDELLSIEEFLELNTKNMELGGLENVLKNAFEALDVNGDEVVTAEELYEVMGDDLGFELSLEDCQGIIASIDIDGDGAVSFDDFQLIVNSL